jgi:hypothetical protein
MSLVSLALALSGVPVVVFNNSYNPASLRRKFYGAKTLE